MISLRRFPEPGPSPWIPFRHETVTFTQKTTATMATPPNPVPDFEFHGFKRSELLAAFQRQGRCASDPVPEIHFVTFANKRPKDSKFCRWCWAFFS